MGDDIRKDMSRAQGGKGVALRNQKQLFALGLPMTIGQSPAEGTFCTIFLSTNHDAAYDNAYLYFYVEQFGRPALFEKIQIAPAENAAQPQLQYTIGSCAAEFWSAYIELVNGSLPAVPLVSSIVASGVENIPSGSGGGTYTGAFPIVVTGTVISIDDSAIPWTQVGGLGGVIEAVDTTASVIAGGATSPGGGGVQSFAFGPASVASSPGAAAFGGGTASNANDFAAFGQATGGGSAAFNGGSASGNGAFAACGALAQSVYDFAAGNGATANGTNSAAFANSTAAGPGSFAATGGSVIAQHGFAAGPGSQVNQQNGMALFGGIANQNGSLAIGPITTLQAGGIAIGTFGGPSIEIGNSSNDVQITVPGGSNGILRVNGFTALEASGGAVLFAPGGTYMVNFNGGSGEATFGYNVAIGSVLGGSYNGGTGGCAFLADVSTAPSASAVAGGGILFVDGGSLKYVGGTGVITILAP